MIHTTRGLFAKIEADKRKLQNVTTKTIDASLKVKKPKKGALKPTMITTRDIGSANDIAERKKLVAIAKERKKEANKEAKKKKVKLVEPSKKLKAELEAAGLKMKKPWKEMTKEEKSAEMKRRVEVGKANKEEKAKADKKKEA